MCWLTEIHSDLASESVEEEEVAKALLQLERTTNIVDLRLTECKLKQYLVKRIKM